MQFLFERDVNHSEKVGEPIVVDTLEDGTKLYSLDKVLKLVLGFVDECWRADAISEIINGNQLADDKIDDIFLPEYRRANESWVQKTKKKIQDKQNIQTWLETSAWTVTEFCALLCGESPNVDFVPEPGIIMPLKREIELGNIPSHYCSNKNCKEPCYHPSVLINWAISRGQDVPVYLKSFLDEYNKKRQSVMPLNIDLLPAIMDSNHPNYAPELAAAVDCWQSKLFGNHDKYCSQKHIVEYLESQWADKLPSAKGDVQFPSDATYNRIARVVTPERRKKGGSPKKI